MTDENEKALLSLQKNSHSGNSESGYSAGTSMMTPFESQAAMTDGSKRKMQCMLWMVKCTKRDFTSTLVGESDTALNVWNEMENRYIFHLLHFCFADREFSLNLWKFGMSLDDERIVQRCEGIQNLSCQQI